MSEVRASKMLLNLTVLLMLLRFRPAWGSENEKVLATYICDDEKVTEIQHQLELLSTANENLRLRLEILDHRLNVSSGQSNRVIDILNEITRKLPAENSTNQIEENVQKRLKILDHRLTETSKEINRRVTEHLDAINRSLAESSNAINRRLADLSNENAQMRLKILNHCMAEGSKEHNSRDAERLDAMHRSLDEISGSSFSFVNTPSSIDYQFGPVSGARFSFKVNAAHDAHLALVPSPKIIGPIYEIFIGGWRNTKSAIRKNHSQSDNVVVETPGILKAGKFRGFWICWYGNAITVGTEDKAGAFMSFEAPDFPVNFVGIRTLRGVNGNWLLHTPDAFAGAPETSTPAMCSQNKK